MQEKTKRWRNVRSYPVSEIDEGIRRSLNASLEWLESAYPLLHLGKKTKAFIHYTFAVEEFGKAILLNERKKEAITKQETMICNDNVTFCDHDAKIKKAEETLRDPSTKIRLIDESKFLLLFLILPLSTMKFPSWNLKTSENFLTKVISLVSITESL